MKCKKCGQKTLTEYCFGCMAKMLGDEIDIDLSKAILQSFKEADIKIVLNAGIPFCTMCSGPMGIESAIKGMCRRCYKMLTFGMFHGKSPETIDWNAVATQAITVDTPEPPTAITLEKLKAIYDKMVETDKIYQPKEFKLVDWEAFDDDYPSPFKAHLEYGLPIQHYNCRCVDPFTPPPFWGTPINDKEIWGHDLEHWMTLHFGNTDPRLEPRL